MISINQSLIILNTLKPYKPKKLGVFGSYARGDSNAKSDLDILVEFNAKINLLDLIGLEQQLSKALGLNVDLVTSKSLSPYIKEEIERDFKSLL
jgi:uncharacterized protein